MRKKETIRRSTLISTIKQRNSREKENSETTKKADMHLPSLREKKYRGQGDEAHAQMSSIVPKDPTEPTLWFMMPFQVDYSLSVNNRDPLEFFSKVIISSRSLLPGSEYFPTQHSTFSGLQIRVCSLQGNLKNSMMCMSMKNFKRTNFCLLASICCLIELTCLGMHLGSASILITLL